MSSRFLLFTSLVAILAFANEVLAQTEPKKKDWEIISAAALYNKPDYLGANTYNWQLLPDIQVNYKDKFFSSLIDGVGYNTINQNGLRIGPLSKLRFKRSEKSGNTAIRFNNDQPQGLKGMGNVNTVLELGGFAEYALKGVVGRIEVRQGLNNPKGLSSEFELEYTYEYRHVEFSIGTFATVADRQFNNSYFGVTEAQSISSGLDQHSAKAGLVSYGLEWDLTVPVSLQSAITIFGRNEKLSSNIARSPLIKDRGTRSQTTIGISFGHSFDFSALR